MGSTRVAVLGGGITGLTVHRRLIENGAESTLYEAQAVPGGLARSRITRGYVFDQCGGHIFNSRSQAVLDWVFRLLPRESWTFQPRLAKILLEGTLVDYPLELSLHQLDVDTQVECLVDLASRQGGADAADLEEWFIRSFGETLARLYLIPYNSKVWRFPLARMEHQWVSDKMPQPSLGEIFRALVTRSSRESKMPHSTFYYPTAGGSQALVDAIAGGLPGIRTSNAVMSLRRHGVQWTVNDQESYETVISTVPLKELFRALVDVPGEVARAVGDLRYNSITSTLVEHDLGPSISWIYLPGPETVCNKVSNVGRFSPRSCPDGSPTSMLVDTIGRHDAGSVRDDVRKLFPIGDVIDHHVTEYAYVVFDLDHRRNVGVVLEYLGRLGIPCVGRFAEWQYYNMDVCIGRALEAADAVLAR
ncbi:MAG: FAD-dependent oxidoreductase [Candidatus Riflebacteria bacterium]|nr:FAD-dependent oxidoreductase [Candidatus Riflebacteria bacterium]